MVALSFQTQAESVQRRSSGAVEESLVIREDAALWLERPHEQPGADRLTLLAVPEHPLLTRFDGERGAVSEDLVLLRCPLSAAHAQALRETLPWLNPMPLGLRLSAGFGDRLGLATPGHIRALRRVQRTSPQAPVATIFAQQSVRENARTGRTPQQVLDDATWGAFAAGWREGVGADADHIKTTEDIDAFAAAGYSLYTFDPGVFVDDSAERASPAALADAFAALPWRQLETTPAALLARFAGRSIPLETRALALADEEVARAAVKYGRALTHVAALHRHLVQSGAPFEVEVSVDETALPTTPAEHLYIAAELQRLGVRCVSLAPRYVGRFEKGIDYIGDLDMLATDLATHAEIARAFGPYKLSLHSGSDKFSIYPIFAAATRGMLHLKTAGTSYVEALRVVAQVSPALFREILALACEAYGRDAESYHVSANPARIPTVASAGELARLLDDPDARQVLHVTFGSVLGRERELLLAVLRAHAELYARTLEAHFVRHLEPLVAHSTT